MTVQRHTTSFLPVPVMAMSYSMARTRISRSTISRLRHRLQLKACLVMFRLQRNQSPNLAHSLAPFGRWASREIGGRTLFAK